MYGLPMSITDALYERIEPARSIQYRGKDAYRIDLELKEALISKHWSLIISTDDFELLALTLNDPEDEQKGELIEFDGEIVSNDMTIPRIRHWYDKGTREYLGSDIIVNEIRE
jgi:hypothetical protein